MYERKITPRIKEALKDTPAIIINGARQTGKSTLAKSLIGPAFDAQYLSFDNNNTLAHAKLDPVGFISELAGPVILDEIQRTPELFLSIKHAIDQNRKPGQFLLTGSANILSLPKLGDSLTGRVELFELWPLSQEEIGEKESSFLQNAFGDKPIRKVEPIKKTALQKRIFSGSFPEAIIRPTNRQEAWFESYIDTLLQRDIRNISDIHGLAKLPKLVSILATRSAKLLNLSDIAASTSIPYATLSRYIDVLEATYLIQLIPAWSSNLGLRLVKAPKLLINDTGLLASILGINDERLEKDPSLFGSLLETFVGMELKKLISYNSERIGLYHFRTLALHEVDFVLEKKNGDLVGIEVKASSSISQSDLKGLKNLAESTKQKFKRGIVLYGGEEVLPLGEKLLAIPISALWS
jgi:predicted AAA+ superfamily ATPase